MVDTVGNKSTLRIHYDHNRHGVIFTLTRDIGNRRLGYRLQINDEQLIQIEHPRALVFDIIDRLERMIQREEMEFIDG